MVAHAAHSVTRSAARFALCRCFSRSLLRFGAPLAPGTNFVKFVVGQMFDPDKRIVRRAYSNEFVEFYLNGRAIAVLRILDQEDHQERDDRSAGVDHQLPCIGIMKYGTGDRPDDDDAGGDHERRSAPGSLGCPIGYVAKHFSGTTILMVVFILSGRWILCRPHLTSLSGFGYDPRTNPNGTRKFRS